MAGPHWRPLRCDWNLVHVRSERLSHFTVKSFRLHSETCRCSARTLRHPRAIGCDQILILFMFGKSRWPMRNLCLPCKLLAIQVACELRCTTVSADFCICWGSGNGTPVGVIIFWSTLSKILEQGILFYRIAQNITEVKLLAVIWLASFSTRWKVNILIFD